MTIEELREKHSETSHQIFGMSHAAISIEFALGELNHMRNYYETILRENVLFQNDFAEQFRLGLSMSLPVIKSRMATLQSQLKQEEK